MATDSLPHRLLAHPRLWWLAAAVLGFCVVALVVARHMSARVQSDLLRRAGWEIHDLSLVDDRVESYDVVRALVLAPDGTLWAATDYVPLSYDGHRWQSYDQVDDWPFGDMRALVSNSDGANTVDSDGRTWTGGRVCTGGNYPDQWCSCVITSERETGQVPLQFDIPDSPCGNVSAMDYDQAGTLWVGFWTDIRHQSRFGLASYSGNEWTFYETGDIPDPVLPAGASLEALLVDSSGDLWLGLMGGPYVARISPASARLSADPVPDRVTLARRVSNTLAWPLGVVFSIVSAIAAWSTYLNSKSGLAWAQRLAGERSLPTAGSRPALRSLVVRILSAGLFLAIWLLVNVLFIWKSALDLQGWHVVTSALLVLAGLDFIVGAAAASLASFGARALKSSPSPSRTVLGYLALVLGILIFVACFGLTWFAVGMLATG